MSFFSLAEPTTNTGLLDDLTAWAEACHELRLADDGKLAALRAALADARAGKLEHPAPPVLTVMLLGASGAGKSELLNALAGARIAASNYIRPTTSRPTIYVHTSLGSERLFEFGTELGELSRSSADALRRHSRPELERLILIDAPDYDSFRQEHRATVLGLLPLVDVVFYVVTPYNYKDDLGWQTVLAERGRRAFAFVINKWDAEGKPPVAAGAPDVDADLLRMLERAGYHKPLLFRTSARHWVRRSTGELEPGAPPDAALPSPADEDPPGDQFRELQRWLSSGLSLGAVEQIKRRRRRALWGSLAGALHAALPRSEATQGSLASGEAAAALEAGLGALREQIWQTLKPGLAAQAHALAELHDREGTPTSPGPFGLVLRATHGAGRRAGKVAQHAHAVAQGPGAAAMAVAKAQLSGPAADTPAATAQVAAPPSAASYGALAIVPANLGGYLSRQLSALEWRGRELGLEMSWLGDAWQTQATRAEAELLDTATVAQAELAGRQVSRGRRIATTTALIVFEVATVAVLGVALYRLVIGFVTGAYLTLTFLANFAALLLCLGLLGGLVLALIIPRSERAMRRELETRLRSVLQAQVASLTDAMHAYFRRAAALQAEGRAALARCSTEIQALGQEPSPEPGGAPDATEGLFSAATTAGAAPAALAAAQR